MTEPGSNTPVLIAAGTVQQRFETAGEGLEPVALMIAALRRAADAAGCPEILARADRIEVPKGIWGYSNPARLVADAIGAVDSRTVLAEIGVLQQTLINRACNSIAAGEAGVVLVTGAEAKHRALRCQIAGIEIPETAQSDCEPDVTLTPQSELWSPVESAAGLGMPVGYYAILDSALRHAQGLSVEQHRDQLASIYEAFSRCAAANEDAWAREMVSAETIRNSSAGNRMLAFPYTKLHNSQWNVDQAAGLVFCSAGVARELNIPPEKWLYPLASAESNAMSAVSARRHLHRNHGFNIAGNRALELAGKAIGEIDLLDLYSCFPQAVRSQLQELGLSAERPLTVTGGMTFGGGPLNNYVLQATAKMADLLREMPSASGLVTSISGMNTKQACALYSATPNPAGWQYADVTEAVSLATELAEVVGDCDGSATIAGYTVLFEGNAASRAVAVCDLPDRRRTVAFSEDTALMQAMQREEFTGRAVHIAGGRFQLLD